VQRSHRNGKWAIVDCDSTFRWTTIGRWTIGRWTGAGVSVRNKSVPDSDRGRLTGPSSSPVSSWHSWFCGSHCLTWATCTAG
jgi:hypothetical protein